MRPIDADRLWLEMSYDQTVDQYCYPCIERIWKAIENTPTVDAVPVIRCKDCKWCVELHDIDIDTIVPYLQCTNWNGMTDADGYCCAAERKEE